MKVYLVGGTEDGVRLDDGPQPPETLRRYFKAGDKEWSEFYSHTDIDPIVDGYAPMRHMGTD
ncbi:MAG: hypothetical protein JWP14_3247 [Frankiales bacterium]|nr:hypothetical protein [Frankiales bacterium]